ncbi:MAG: hypothetical protein U0271_18880 [Polyangiaceae bacterium]
MDNNLGTGQSAEVRVGAGAELARMLTIVKRALLNWKPSLIIVLIGIVGGLSYALVRKPTYRSETIVIYRQGVRLSQEGGGASLTLGTRLQEMLQARSRLEIIIEELDLYPDVRQKRGMHEAVEEFRKDITFKARSTDTFSISYKAGDPDKVKLVTERLSQSLIEENQKLRVEQSRVQSEFLEAQKKRSEDDLKEKERLLAVFLSEHPEFALDQNSSNFGASLRAQRDAEERAKGAPVVPAARDASLDAMKRQAARLDAAISGDASAPTRPEAAADPAAEAARQQAEANLAAAKADLNAKRSTYTDQHPDVMAAKKRVTAAEDALKVAEDKVNASRIANAATLPPAIDPDATKQSLRDKKRKLEADIAAREKDLASGSPAKTEPPKTFNDEASNIVSLETDWARISRDVSEARDQMNELERNYFRAQIEASSSIGGYSDQVVVLDPAYVPTRPEPPGKSLILLLAAGASFAIAMVLAFLRALLDSRIYEEADLARFAPVLAVVRKGGGRRWFSR